jgi:thioredoxin-related protein
LNYIKFTLFITCLFNIGVAICEPINSDLQISRLAHPEIKYVESLSEEGLSAFQTGRILLLYVSRPDCPFCQKLESDVLYPLIRGKRFDGKVVLREISLSDSLVVGFDSIQGSASGKLARYDIAGTPTLLFLDKNGIELTEKLSGYFSKDFYWSYFEKSIDRAYSRLKASL